MTKSTKAALERKHERRWDKNMTLLNRMVPRIIPEGKVIVHNHVDSWWPLDGFYVWLKPISDPKIVVCNCGWAPELGTHYRIFGTRAEDKHEVTLTNEAARASAEAPKKKGGE
jgi:hypothetical protein